MVVHFKNYCNTYGSVASYIIGLFFRVAGGEPLIDLEPFIHFPGWNGKEQMFPFRTLAMLLSLISVVVFSMLSKWIFESGRLPPSWDVLRCVVNIPEDVVRVGEPQEGEMTAMSDLQVSNPFNYYKYVKFPIGHWKNELFALLVWSNYRYVHSF